MGYFKRRYGRPAALGGISDVAQAALDVSSDPYLPEAVCRVRQLKAIESRTAVPPCVTTAPDLVGGIGLRKAMRPLRAFVYAEQHPWLYAVVVATVVGVPALIGYRLGKGS